MDNELMETLLFAGFGLYAMTTVIFLFLWLRTLRTQDGIGLAFLKTLTFGVFIGSFVVTIVRCCTLYVDSWDVNFGRVVAIINPITLLGVGFYLNYLFHHRTGKK